MPRDSDPYKLSSPRKYLLAMVVFLVLVGFVALILLASIRTAFMANPGLNGLILGVFAIGIVLALRQVLRLYPEISWVNGFRQNDPSLEGRGAPPLVAPMAVFLGDRDGRNGHGGGLSISTDIMRSILDSIGTRLDETRDVVRYITGLLIFLGLLGTFWGLQETVGSVGKVISSIRVGTGGDMGVMFEELKQGLAEPLGGMGTAFAASLFGLAGSLVLGFLDLQGSQAQNRFYTELEDWLSTLTEASVGGGESATPRIVGLDVSEFRAQVDRLARIMSEGAAGAGGAVAGSQSRAATAAMADLAEGIQGLVQHMRAEQQIIRQWVEAQSDQQQDIQRLIQMLLREPEKVGGGRGMRS